MTMKKLMLATAIALCLTAPAFAQDNNTDGQQANNGGDQAQPAPVVGRMERPLPQGFQGIGTEENKTWTSTWEKIWSSDGTCVWHVRVNSVITNTLPDGTRVQEPAWEYFSVKVPCDQNPPYVTGVELPIQYVQGTPGPVVAGDPPPPPPPPPPAQTDCPGRDDWKGMTILAGNDVAYRYEDGTTILCRNGKFVGMIPPMVRKIVVVIPPAVRIAQPSEAENTAKELEKILTDDPEAGEDLLSGGGKSGDGENLAKELEKLLNGDGKSRQSEQQTPKNQQQEAAKQSNFKSAQTEPQAPAKSDAKTETKTDTRTDAKVDLKTETKTDTKVDSKTETKIETNPEHSMRSATPDKVDAAKQVAHAAPVEHTADVRNVEAHQAIGHVTPNLAASHMNAIGGLGAMHGNGMSAMHMGGLGGLGGLGGMHMGGMGGFGGMRMGGLGGMHFGRM